LGQEGQYVGPMGRFSFRQPTNNPFAIDHGWGLPESGQDLNLIKTDTAGFFTPENGIQNGLQHEDDEAER